MISYYDILTSNLFVNHKILSVAYVTLLGHDVLFQDGKCLLFYKPRFRL